MQDITTLPPSLGPSLPNQRWQIYQPQPQLSKDLAKEIGLSPLLAQVVINRGFDTGETAKAFLNSESQVLPSPLEEFPDLATSIELLQKAILQGDKIAICGDYDADGMTSTALLIRSFKALGGNVDYAIPSRMREGYGINNRIVEEFHREGVGLILTVDNGISAYQPIARARELGLNVIITDHHDIPPKLPPANAILNPKLISKTSPYRGLAGVGVAYVLAISLAQKMNKMKGLVNPLLELFTLGTIADLAPLSGVNRRWVKRGLGLLPYSQLAGVKALIHVTGVQGNKKEPEILSNPLPLPLSLKPEDIGFRLGPRINAVGRLADPQIVIELLTSDDIKIALERAIQCEETNHKRQQLCAEIEADAIALYEENQIDLQRERVLVLVQQGWHHGVIGIVASRLVERYGVPVFIGTYEEELEEEDRIDCQQENADDTEVTESCDRTTKLTEKNQDLEIKVVRESVVKKIRGSARGIPEFNIFDALQFCDDLLGKYGGHKAAGGFSLPAENLEEFRKRLSAFACQSLQIEHLKPLVVIDVKADFEQINFDLYHQINALQPCGIDNDDPVFWTENVRVIEQKIVGKKHIKLTLGQDSGISQNSTLKFPKLTAIAWRWRDYFPLPPRIDIAYQLRENCWNGDRSVELELLGVRLPTQEVYSTALVPKSMEFNFRDRTYTCTLSQQGAVKELRIRNSQGQILAVQQGQRMGLLGTKRENAREVDVSQPFFYKLIKTAIAALGIEK